MYSVIQITWAQARSSRSKLVLRALISCNVCAWVRVWQRILLKLCAYANLWIYEYFRQEIKANNPFKVSSKYSYANIWCTKREELLTEKERNKLFESELDGTKFYLNIEIAHANPKPNRLVLGSLWPPPLLPPQNVMQSQSQATNRVSGERKIKKSFKFNFWVRFSAIVQCRQC